LLDLAMVPAARLSIPRSIAPTLAETCSKLKHVFEGHAEATWKLSEAAGTPSIRRSIERAFDLMTTDDQ
jgi:hypothetical protein